MKPSRLILLSSLVVLGVGGLAALGAFYLDSARASVGPLPAEALVLPADSAFVVGVDVKRIVKSPLYQRFAKELGPSALEELQQKTGIDPARDLDQVVFAGKASPDAGYLAFVTGSFDGYKLGRLLEAEKGVTWKKEGSATIYFFNEGQKGADAVAFLGEHALVVGSAPAVEGAASRGQDARALRSNVVLMEQLAKIRPGSTFWAVADRTLLASMPAKIPSSDGGSSSFQLPALKTLRITGDLDPLVAVDATGGTADEASAKNLADVVRGMLAFAALSAGQRPELKSLTTAISVTTEASEVHVSGRFPYAMLDALQPKPPAKSSPR